MLATYDPRSPSACRLRVRKGRAFLDASIASSATENFVAILQLAQSLIERPQRLTRDWQTWVEHLGGRHTGVWQPDSSFALVWNDSGVDVVADVGHAPSWEGGRARWLRTRVRARRLDGGGPFSLHADDLPRRQRPRVGRERVPLPTADATAIETAIAGGAIVAVAGTRDEIVAVIPGVVHDPETLRRAGALVARLAGQGAPRVGPYR